ncbi:MAG: hypothetical protein B6D61_05410 [Bacteroidetes bacterium 4484_249]|nr:MAG: hypothetical protein B6D61_05410 [Bacteroidetes bacterium 4484_249]
MKILILIEQNPFFQSSASANRWRTLIEGLAELGADVKLIITGGFNHPAEYKQLGFSGTFGNIKYQYLSFLFHHNIWLRRINKYVLAPILQPFVLHLSKKLVRKHKPDIVWTTSSLEGFRLAVAIKKSDIPVLLFLEMSEFLDIYLSNEGRSIHKKGGRDRQYYFEDKAFHAYDLMALMTKTLLKHYKSFPQPAPKLLHLPMTVDLNRFNPLNKYPYPDGLKKPYIAFIGVMNNQKEGINILIDAFARISNKFPEYSLYLFGFYHYDTPGHLKQIKDLGLENNICYKGEISREEVPNVLMNAGLLVLPRPDSKQAQGGFPTKLGEYLATGKPVCVTRVGEIPEYLEDGKSVFMAKPGDTDSFAYAMERALSNPVLAKEVGKNGRKVAEKYFNMEKQAEKLYNFLFENIS